MNDRSKPRSGPTRRAVLAAAGLGAAWPVWAQPRCAPAGRTIAVGAAGGLFVGLQSHPRTLALEPGEIVLTLDDGPLPGQTDRVLDALKSYGVSATFFLVGRNAQAHPALVRRMAAESHTVAHHTWSHPWTLRERSIEVGRREIEQGIRAVQEAQGLPGASVSTPFFRYPGFADTAPLNAWLAERNFAVFGSDLWASDWQAMAPERQLDLVMRRLRRAGSGIVLLHDVVPQTAAMFPAFLAALCAGGYRVVKLVPGGTTPALVAAGPAWRSQTARIIASRG